MEYSNQQLRTLCLEGVISTTDYFTYRLQLRRQKTVDRKKRFLLANLSEEESIRFLRFTPHEINRLITCLKIPIVCTTDRRETFTGVEGFCVLLRRLAYPNRLCELKGMFHRHISSLSRIFNWMLNYVYSKVHHKMESLNHEWLSMECLHNFAEIIVQAGSRYPNVVGFLDGTARPICRPTYHQEQQYSGYKKQHVVKYQSVVFPNGIIGRMDGPINGRRHDSAILHISKLLLELQAKFVCADGTSFALYGDPGYANQKFIKVGYKNHRVLTPAQQSFNTDMSSLRVNVEYGFGKILQTFAFLDFKKNQKLYLQSLKEMYIVAAVLTNCITCMRGCQVSDYFHCPPPTLEEYL